LGVSSWGTSDASESEAVGRFVPAALLSNLSNDTVSGVVGVDWSELVAGIDALDGDDGEIISKLNIQRPSVSNL